MDKEFGEKVQLIALESLPSDEDLAGPAPDNDFIKTVESFNVIDPVILTREKDKLVVVDGRRRIKAARKAGYKEIKALIYDNLTKDDIATWSLILNDQRSANVITEFQFLSQLAKNSRWDELQKAYGFNKAHVEKVLTLANIHNIGVFVSAHESGKITEATLFEIAKLGEKRQSYIRDLLKTKGKVTQSDVKEAQRLFNAEAISTMPEFDEISVIPLTENSHVMQFAVTLPSSSTIATLYDDIQAAYAAMEGESGAKLFRLIEVG